jgi:histidine triad (HIT) family protein
MEYDNDNIFAKILRNEIPAERVYEDEHTLVIMDIMPRVDGHTLVIPKTPCRNMLDASAEQMSTCLNTVQKVGRAMMDKLGADGISVQQFNEEAGGQVVFHLHYHVLPRTAGETLRPPGIMGDSAVIESYAHKLRAALAD